MDISNETIHPGVGFSPEDREVFNQPAFRASLIHSNLPELDYAGNTGVVNAITKGIPSLGVAAVETLGTSFGVLDQESYQAFIQDNMPSMYNYYKRNEEGVKLIADIGTAFIPATAAVKAIQGGSWLARLAKTARIPQADKIFTSASNYNRLYRQMRKQDLVAARQ